MSNLKALAEIKRLTGTLITIREFESVGQSIVTETTITVLINRAKSKRSRGGITRVTERGQEVYQFTRNRLGWKLTDRVVVWWRTDELHGAGLVSAEED